MLLCLIKVVVMNASYMNRCFYSAATIFINVIYTLICRAFGEKCKVLLKSSSNSDENILKLIVNVLLEEKCTLLLLKRITILDADVSILLLEGKIRRLTYCNF